MTKVKPSKKKSAASSPHADGSQPCRGRLLLVEDHPPTRDAIKQLLLSRRFEVSAAATVADAWCQLEDSKFDLLISDIGLPDGDGYLLMRELQELHGMRGIALTGFDSEDDFVLSKEAGFSAHLVKPVKAELLDKTLAALGL